MVAEKARRLVIDNKAKWQLQKAYNYIKKDAPKSALKVKQEILFSIRNLMKSPEIHAPDQYKTNNNGSYRAYELYSYRITYFVSKEEIRVIRIRHSKMSPMTY